MNTPLAARFRAIITGPLSGAPNDSDCRQESYGGPRLHDSAGTKRKKDKDDVGPSNSKVPRRAVEAGSSAREVQNKSCCLCRALQLISSFHIANGNIPESRGIAESAARSF